MRKTTDLIVIFGPPAVGKMTVGQELAAITGFKLFHNHMTIDLLTQIFSFHSNEFHLLCDEFRRRVIEEAAKSSEHPGLIFTFVWGFNNESDKQTIDAYKKIIEDAGGNVWFVELEADFTERLDRNKSPNRLAHKKKSKTDKTEATIRDWENRFRMNTEEDFFYKDHFIKINNTKISAHETALMVAKKFGLSSN